MSSCVIYMYLNKAIELDKKQEVWFYYSLLIANSPKLLAAATNLSWTMNTLHYFLNLFTRYTWYFGVGFNLYFYKAYISAPRGRG